LFGVRLGAKYCVDLVHEGTLFRKDPKGRRPKALLYLIKPREGRCNGGRATLIGSEQNIMPGWNDRADIG
jgi:hypothetical protein